MHLIKRRSKNLKHLNSSQLESIFKTNLYPFHFSSFPFFFIHQMIVGIVFTLIGFALHIWLVSEAYMYLSTSFSPYLGFQEIRYQLRAYIAFKHIPKSIQSRILSYYDFSFKDKFYSREEISTLFGEELRQSIAIEICQEQLWKNYLFKILPENLLKPIAICMMEETYLQNDIISRNDYNRGQVWTTL